MSESVENWSPAYLREKERSRSLYQEIFREDTQAFVDYYYEYKTRDNRILALEKDGQLISMLHRNPYSMIVNGYQVDADYIVAVATREAYRHQGCMRALLERALVDMAEEEMPFTFLMPASESIYAPFDFVWICPHTKLPGRVARMSAREQNRYLAGRYQVFCKRDARYLEYQEAERRAEEQETAAGEIPPYMARITDVCQMLRMVHSREGKTTVLQIKDPIIEKNDGYFLWESSPEKSSIRRLTEIPERVDLALTIGELTSMVFQSFRICLSELV